MSSGLQILQQQILIVLSAEEDGLHWMRSLGLADMLAIAAAEKTTSRNREQKMCRQIEDNIFLLFLDSYPAFKMLGNTSALIGGVSYLQCQRNPTF